MDTMIELPAMRRSAELAPNTADADTRTVEVVWSAGARVRRVTFFGEPYDEELSLDPAHVRLDRLNAGAPFLKVHELDTLDAVIGSVVPGSARIENGRGIALVRISERADVEPIWRDIQAGHIRAVSIGYQVHRFEVSKPEAARELWRAVDWTPFEVSAVAVGADPAAGFRAQQPLHDCVLHRRDAPSTTKGPIPMMDKTQTPASDAATPATTQPTVPVETEDTPMTEPKVAAPDPKVAASETRSQPMTQATPAPDTEAVATRAREAERDRVSTIYDLAGRLNLARGFAEELVKRGVSVDESRRLILDQVAAKSDETRTFPHISVPLGGRDERITRRDAVANALLHRYSPTLFQLEDAARQYRGMTLLELARESLGNAGVNTRGLSRDEVATRALHSTSDFPEILSAVTNKTLRQAYEAYPRTFMLFCRQVLATDFKAMHRVQLGEAPQLLEVGESGEFKRGTLGESKESYKVKTYGRVVAITRQTLINDDLDAFTRIPAMYGNSIAQLESDVVWGIITANPAMADGNALFHTTHKNLAGTGAALAVEAVGAARAAMAKQTGLDKKTVLNVRPAFLIVPASLELKAEQLVAQNLVPASRIDVTGLWGAVEGYAITALESPRASITTLSRHFGFDAVETEGVIRFVMRGRASVATLAPDDLVAPREGDVLELTRGQETELPQALKWQVARADEDYDAALVEARRITVDTTRIASESFPMAVPPEEAERRCRRALMEAWVGRETAAFRLPPSRLALDPADAIRLAHDGRLVDLRLVSIADAEARGIEAVRQDRATYDLPPGDPRAASLTRAVVFGAPDAVLMDLPQLTEDQPAHRPLVAAHAVPWPGEMAVFRSPSTDGFDLLTTFGSRARTGTLVSDFYAGPTSRFDLGNALVVDLLTGTLESVTDLTLFGGANALAIESTPGVWEIVQAGAAELLAPGRYRMTRLLRGQRGTEGAMGNPAPAGARVVLLDDSLASLPIAEADLGLPWSWRIGPASRSVSDETYVAQAFTPEGVGLRPFSVAHVEQPWRKPRTPGDLTIRWTRRSRSLAADNWSAVEVPMAEELEAYEVEILDGATVKRVLSTATTSAVYTAAQQTADWGALIAPGDTLDIRIFQLSALIGRGAAKTVTLTL